MEEHLHQSHPQQDLVPQHQAQVLRQYQAGVLLQQHQAALVAVQDLERQRLQKLSQDSGANPPL